jgi:hypothetical protein
VNYTVEQIERLEADHLRTAVDLQNLALEGLLQSQDQTDVNVKKHLTHGAGRRIDVIQRSMRRIFDIFPPAREVPLDRNALADAQMFLHAFIVNVFGVFDNWAWAFILRHGLQDSFRKRTTIGMFKEQLQAFLPASLREYVTSAAIRTWHKNYLIGYRDALVHRIPLYIPPASFTAAEVQRYEELKTLELACIRNHEWQRLDEVRVEMDALGSALPHFMHEFSGAPDATPVILHPQLISDGMTVVEFGRRFYATWHERSAG